MKPLVIGHDAMRRTVQEIAVPDPQQAKQDRHVLRHRRVTEMQVHPGRAGQHAGKGVGTNPDHHRQSDGRPQRIAPANPLVEIEHAVRIHAPAHRHIRRRRHGGHAGPFGGKPGARQRGVAHCLGRGEGLRGHDDKRSRRIAACQDIVKMARVDIRHVMHARPVGMASQRRADHRRAKVGTADPDIHHIIDMTVALAFGEIDEPCEFGAGCPRPVTLRHMHDGPVFGTVDPLAGEQRRDAALQPRLGGKFQQQVKRLLAQFLARDIHPQIAKLAHQRARTAGIAKKVAKMDVTEDGGLFTEFGGGFC